MSIATNVARSVILLVSAPSLIHGCANYYRLHSMHIPGREKLEEAINNLQALPCAILSQLSPQ